MTSRTASVAALISAPLSACGSADVGAPAPESDQLHQALEAEPSDPFVGLTDDAKRDWRMAAYDPTGTGNNTKEKALGPDTVGDLEVKWTFDASVAGAPVAPIHANPVVAGGETYVGSYGGTFYAIGPDGELLWSFDTYAPGPLFTLFFGNKAPIIGAAVLPDIEDSVVFGDIDGRVYKLDRATGALAWSVDLDDHDLGGIWGNSLIIDGDTVYVGLASFETLAPFFPGRTCCTHRGAVVALDLASGATRWRYETIDPSQQGPLPQELVDALGGLETYGPSGGDVWSQPTLDKSTKTLYVGTGQLFSRAPDGSGPPTHDAIIAIDADTGAEKWATSLSDNVDVFRFDILFHEPGSDEYFDKDVADQPKVYRLPNGRKVVGAAQKTGEYHVLDAMTGEVVASTEHLDMITGEGGFQSGGAMEGETVFEHGLTTPVDPSVPYDGVVTGINLTGNEAKWALRIPGSPLFGSLAAANGVVYFQSPFGESPSSPGNPPTWAFYAVDAATGAVLKRVAFDNARALNGPAVSRGRIYAAFGGAFAFGLASPHPEGGVVCLGLPD